MISRPDPMIIQGGMGVAVSAWQLARAVSMTGQLGVVSGTALDLVLSRRLQQGDPGGHIRRALKEFPLPAMAERVVEHYFIPGGKAPDQPFRPLALMRHELSRGRQELIAVANFVEVFLAKEGHNGVVGVNYLEKIQFPTLASLFGAMIAKVDYVLMGAGIPTTIPGAIEAICAGKTAELALRVEDARPGESFLTRFDPRELTDDHVPWMEPPKFLPIVASATLATMLSRKATGPVYGFVVEGPTAGGHNAPPRGPLQLNERGEPLYGERDEVDLQAMRSLDKPFWLAGSYGSAERLSEALDAGAAGIQVGTAFAFCRESGLDKQFKRETIQKSRQGKLVVFTDPCASPTGFPFKVLEVSGSLSEADVYEQRQRVCDLGYLRHAYRKDDGSIGWRCPSEPVDIYESKGGRTEETVGRKCVCNALLANIGLEQVRGKNEPEKQLVTCGNDVVNIHRFLPHDDAQDYGAKDVVDQLLSSVRPKTQWHASRSTVVSHTRPIASGRPISGNADFGCSSP